MAKYIEKEEQSAGLIGKVFDSFDTDSHSDAPSIFAVRNAFSNPNLIINGDFQVWQRGTEFTKAGYTADRWMCSIGAGSTAKINSIPSKTGMHIETNGNEIQLDYFFEGADTTILSNKIVTISLEFDSTLEIEIRLRYGIGNVHNTIATTKEKKLTAETPLLTNGNWLNVSLIVKGTGNLYLVKMEKGNIATISSPRFIAEELALCSRYFQYIKFDETTPYKNGNAFTGKQFPVKMRSTPTVAEKAFYRNGNVVTDKFVSYADITNQWIGSLTFDTNLDVMAGYVLLDAEIYPS